MATVTGRVESANSKPQTTRFGVKAKIGLKINGEWYNALAEQGFNVDQYKGQEITASFTDDSYGHKLDPKSIVVTAGAAPATGAAPAAHAAPATKAWAGEAGVRVGMGINNAVLLAAHGKIRLESIPAVAAQIMRLNADLNAEYDDILNVEEGWVLKSASQSAAQVAPAVSASPVVAKAAAVPATAPAPATSATPAAAPAPRARRRAVTTEPAAPAAPVAIATPPAPAVAPAASAGVNFDDDIPF